MRIGRAIGTAMLVAAATLVPWPASAGEVQLGIGLGAAFNVPVASMKERRFLSVIAQEHDYSCGAAAIATLLTFHYGRPVPEKAVFKAMFAKGDPKLIREQGFSMLDMKRYLDSLGYHADGFRLKLDRLEEIGVPVITLLDLGGYRHFVVIKGMTADRVLVGDPASGSKTYDRKMFEGLWSGTILAIRDKPYAAREQFNKVQDWLVRPTAPLGTAMSRSSLAAFTRNLPSYGEY